MGRNKLPLSIFIIMYLLFISAAIAECRVIYVRTSGSDAGSGLTWMLAKKTIQAGIDAANSGDEVWVAKGTYCTRGITLTDGVGLYGGFSGTEKSRSKRKFTVNAAVIDGGGWSGSLLICPEGAVSDTVIDGFTIQNSNTLDNGAAIDCSNSSPTISNNIIRYNYTENLGGAIYCYNSSPVIVNNLIKDNSACVSGVIYCVNSSPAISYNTIQDNWAAENGGGICCISSTAAITYNIITGNGACVGGAVACDSTEVTISHNTISNNTGNDGGGIACYNSTTAAISNNTISGNGGSGIYCEDSAPKICNNLITGNAVHTGGGINCVSCDTVAIINNTIAGNIVYQDGGGIFCNNPAEATVTIANNIIAFNSSGIFNSGGLSVQTNNCLYNPSGYDYSGLTAGAGDILRDPLFVNKNTGNYHLAAGSPCINVGNDFVVTVDMFDMDGHGRIAGLHVDIGSDEYKSVPVAVSVSITSPTVSAAYTTNTPVVNVSGTASSVVTKLTWSNNKGGGGTFAGTTSWSISDITLSAGANVITVTAQDNTGKKAKDTLTVTYDAPPANVSLTPNNGTLLVGKKATLAAKYSDASGYNNIASTCLMLNTTSATTNAFYAYYDANTNKLYLLNDAGNAWLGGGVVPGTAMVLENTKGKLYCKDTTIVKSGNYLTVNWAIETKAPTANQTLGAWISVTDDSGSTDLREQMGTFSVKSPPGNTSIAPNSLTLRVGTKFTITCTNTDADGYTDIADSYLLINTTASTKSAAYVRYNVASNKLYIRNDIDTAWTGGVVPGTDTVLENSACRLYCKETSATGSESTLTISWKLEFKSSYNGKACSAWMSVTDNGGLSENLMKMGEIKVGVPPVNASITPASGGILSATKQTIITKVTDANGYADISGVYLMMNTDFLLTKAVYVRYDALTNLLYVRNDAGTDWVGGYAPGSTNVIQNSVCRLYCQDTSTTKIGNNFIVNWKLEIKGVMSGKRLEAWMYSYDKVGAVAGWDKKATFIVL